MLRTRFKEYVLKEKLDFKKEIGKGKDFHSRLPPTNN